MVGEGTTTIKKVKKNVDPPPRNLPFSALVVDDDPLIRQVQSVILNSVGFKVEVAENGKEAVDLFSAGANFHIVFIDMEMPIMNGIEATKELRAMGVKCKIVGVTSRDSEIDKEVFMFAGLDVCYTKPLVLSMILPSMEELLKS
ncbi:Two-component response regulator ARR22-like protein [Melia azedarach]|uniref:Two-component response regulator ARR22-like protein n=1 Tax=Melia azedarach TaxID=155640 RepID=A0ACC1YBH1_MELAZ|nr:Two-component response regulator ARR22-like protein [Melia azedarach]